jgi:tetratricopeptide (TPR) repeat protein
MLVDLSTTPVAKVLGQVSAERRIGDLQIRAGKFVKTIFFDSGRAVFAASNMKKDRLGEALMALGRITNADFERASALMKEGEHRRRFGEALVKAGVMDKDELGRSVAKQVKRIILSLFEYSEGLAVFEERPCSIPLEYMVSLSMHRMLYIGIKTMMKSRELVLTGLGDLDRWVTLATVPPFPFGVRKCSAEELEILEQSRSRVTLRRLAWAPGGLSLNRLRIVYALVASGLLEDVDGQRQVPQPPVQMETSTFLLSALQARPDPSAREAIRLEVASEVERSAKDDRESWLRVSRQAPRDELIRALEDKMERYHQLLEASGEDAQLKTDIEVVLGRASSALRLLRQTVPATAPPPPPEVIVDDLLLVPDEDVVEKGRPAPAPPAPREPAPPPAAPRKPAAAPRPEPPPPPPPAAKATSPPPAPNPAPAHDSATSNMAIEHMLMEGEVRMTVSDYANAAKVYARLVEAAPDVAMYRAKLAIAMAFHPPLAKQAEREFLEAVRLEPNNADLHYQFALYYKAMKVKSRAINELETAVRLSPRHRLARAELEAMAPKDSALTNLKKLFR